MGLRASYTLLSRIYDPLVGPSTARARRASLARLEGVPSAAVLLAGVGSGLDIPCLPSAHRYVGVDITPAMVRRAARRAARHHREVALQVGDVMMLPYRDASFDAVVMHLILAVVPSPQRALSEAERVLRPGGVILVLDKFLGRGERAPVRRALTPLTARFATRMDVVLEDLLDAQPSLTKESDAPALAGGWFRRVVLRKSSS